MKTFISLLIFLLSAAAGFSQNGIYLYGMMQNAPTESVEIQTTIFSDPPVTVVLETGPTGIIPTQWVELPSQNWSGIQTSFTNCYGNYSTQFLPNTAFPNLVDIPLYLDYCNDSTNSIYGCTDPLAVNFNPAANTDDGSCLYDTTAAANDLCADAIQLVPGTILINNSNATQNEGIWGECWGFGAGEAEQSSVWYSFTTPSVDASIHIEATYDGTNTLTDTQFGIFETCGGAMLYCDGNSSEGLMSALYFGCGELSPNTTYLLMIDGWSGDAGTSYLTYSVDTNCTSVIYGCTDPNALNYNPNATVDDSSCTYAPEPCDANQVSMTIETGSWAYEIGWNLIYEGAIIASAPGYYQDTTSYQEYWCLEVGCYQFEMLDAFGDGWNGATYTINMGDTILASGTLENGTYGAVSFGVNQEGCTTEIFGCTDPEAINYNPAATTDDGSCIYTNTDCTPVFIQFDANSGITGEWQLFQEDSLLQNGEYIGSNQGFEACLEDGCYSLDFNFTTFPDSLSIAVYTIFVDNTPLISGVFHANNEGDVDFQIGLGCDTTISIYGCTDPEAVNYNPEATIDDGSCTYVQEPCDANQISMTIETGSWAYEIGWNLIYEGAIIASAPGYYQDTTSYQEYWCLEDGCYQFEMLDAFGDGWNGASYTINMGDTILASGTLENGTYGAVSFGVNQEGCTTEIFGCTDPEAINYNPAATTDDGSCIYTNTDCTPVFIQFDANSGITGEWQLFQEDSLLQNGEYIGSDQGFEACLEDGCYSLDFNFTTFPDSLSIAVYTIFVDNTPLISGVFHANNEGVVDFQIGLGCDTTISIYGCTDPEAVNYNPEATIDDGSCIYEVDCSISFQIIPDSLGNIVWILPSESIYDAVEVLWDFGDGTTSTEFFPNHTYTDQGPYLLCVTAWFSSPSGTSCTLTFCAEVSGTLINGSGFGPTSFNINIVDGELPTSVDNQGANEEKLNLYPNPVRTQLSIQFEGTATGKRFVAIYDITGKAVYTGILSLSGSRDTKTIQVGQLPAGVYILKVESNKTIETTRFVKTN